MKKITLVIFYLGIQFSGQSQPILDTLMKITNIETSYPSWSPDGKSLVVQSNRMDDNSEIYIMDDSGRSITRLTYNEGLDEYPVMSPDGQTIAFVSEEDGNQEVFVMNIDGSDQANLTKHPSRDIHPQFSPNGKSILFNSNRSGNFDLFELNLEDSSLTQLTHSEDDDTYAHWSPDGKKVVFVRWVLVPEIGKKLGDIFILELETGIEFRVTNDPAFDGWPSWSPDSQKIVFASNRNGLKTFQIHMVNPDGSNLVQITDGEEEMASFTKPVFSKDGSRRIACTRTKDGNVEVYILRTKG